MTEIHSASSQLTDLAAAMRPDWDQRDLTGALAAAHSNGWPFAKACLAAVRLLVRPDSEARDLLAEVASPLERQGMPSLPVDAERRDELLGPARVALARASAEYAASRDRGGDDS